jgi:hypothetical protein
MTRINAQRVSSHSSIRSPRHIGLSPTLTTSTRPTTSGNQPTSPQARQGLTGRNTSEAPDSISRLFFHRLAAQGIRWRVGTNRLRPARRLEGLAHLPHHRAARDRTAEGFCRRTVRLLGQNSQRRFTTATPLEAWRQVRRWRTRQRVGPPVYQPLLSAGGKGASTVNGHEPDRRISQSSE